MTEAAAPNERAPAPAVPVERHYSKDYWDIVISQLARHRLFKVGLVILALMYAVAIYAPFLANDRPFVLTGVDQKEYTSAIGLLRPVSNSVLALVEQSPQEFVPGDAPDAPKSLAAAIDVEIEAARRQLDVLRKSLPDDREDELDRYAELLRTASSLSAEGSRDAAAEAAEEAKSLATTMRKTLAPLGPDEEPGTDDEGRTLGAKLVPTTSYPLFTNLGSREVFFMVLWAFVLTWPVWNRVVNRVLLRGDRETIRRWRKLKAAWVLGITIAATIGWTLATGGEQDTFEASPIKGRLTSGEFVATSPPIFPPLAYGYSETHTEEKFRAPTWTKVSYMTEEGAFPNRKMELTEGMEPPPLVPLDLRAGEPPRNSPWRHPAGVDTLGRDFLVRMIWGGRVSLAVGILSSVLLTLIGVVIGSFAGYFGGWVDIVIMRAIEIIQSIPAFFLILATMSFTDPKTVNPMFAIVIVIALIRWTGVARLVRGEFLRLREQEFVVAARALGFSSMRTMFRHVLPNALSPVLVTAAFAVASGILTESAVSFLGFGVQAPDASWGSLVNESKDPTSWWIQVFPGVLIFVTVTCYNLVGDAIRDALDPKMKV